jgi:hypothetical protein
VDEHEGEACHDAGDTKALDDLDAQRAGLTSRLATRTRAQGRD